MRRKIRRLDSRPRCSVHFEFAGVSLDAPRNLELAMMTHKRKISTSENRGSSGAHVSMERQQQERDFKEIGPDYKTVLYVLKADVCTSTT